MSIATCMIAVYCCSQLVSQMLWDSEGLITHCTPHSELPVLASNSSMEEWADRAEQLFFNKNFYQAIHAYERAHDSRKRNVAEAYFLRTQAIQKTGNRANSSTRSFFEAAVAFDRAAREAVDHDSQKVYFRIGAECYVRANEHVLAAAAYEHAMEYTNAAQQYRLVPRFRDAVRVVQTFRDRVDSTIAESILDVARLYYLRRGDLLYVFCNTVIFGITS